MAMPCLSRPYMPIFMDLPSDFAEGPSRRPGDGRGGFSGRGRHHPAFGPRDSEGPFSHGRGGMFGPRGHHHGGGMFGPRGHYHGVGMFAPYGHHHEYHGHGHPHPRGMHRGRGGRGGRGGMPSPFDFRFLENFTAEMDLFGPQDKLERHQSDSPVDFVPRADVFNSPTEYVVHVSLPGASKSDVSVDYDPEESTLRLSGIVQRPEFSEDLHRGMVIEERNREVGVFGRNIQLGTREAPASVDNENISAKFVDGVLIVRLPKRQSTPAQFQKKVYLEGVHHDDNNVGKGTEPETSHVNEKHASVVEVEDEADTMHVDSETEPGDLLTEVEEHSEEHSTYTPSHDSEEEDLYDIVKSNDNIKVDVQ